MADIVARLRKLSNEKTLACWAPSHGEWAQAMREAANMIDRLRGEISARKVLKQPPHKSMPGDWMEQ